MAENSIPVNFDPNAPGLKDLGIFGLPFDSTTASIVLFPVPWEVTVSYSGGTVDGPGAILEASYQVDLFDEDNPDAWKNGIAMEEISGKWAKKSSKLRKKAEKYISALEEGCDPAQDKELKNSLKEINAACAEMNDWVEASTGKLLDAGKLTGLIGGDHSTPLGFIRALAKRNESFGILHIDAHADLRDAYEGFEFSHASIMFNAIKLKQVSKLVSVGIRDYCEQENTLRASDSRIQFFTQRELSRRNFQGESWKGICEEIVSKLPEKVYISFDIDGLDPALCPNTGTPVPDGLGYEQAVFLLTTLANSGKKIIGFDLVEVAPGEGEDEWDGNVGARLLFRICALILKNRVNPKTA